MLFRKVNGIHPRLPYASNIVQQNETPVTTSRESSCTGPLLVISFSYENKRIQAVQC